MHVARLWADAEKDGPQLVRVSTASRMGRQWNVYCLVVININIVRLGRRDGVSKKSEGRSTRDWA
jgi:hypothetical protein